MESHVVDPETLWAMATGGSNVAADPHNPPVSVLGPSAAGVQEACAWMREGLKADISMPRLLFLVGGPGGGKSQAATDLVTGLEPVSATRDLDGRLAHRVYQYQANGRTVTLVNDATIPAADGLSGLEKDIEAALHHEEHLIVCVNRGVLVDEVAHVSSGLAGEVVQWLAKESDQGGKSFLREKVWADPEGLQADAVAVYVDVCSLLEPRPTVQLGADGRLQASSYKIAKFGASSRNATPAGVLFQKVVSQFQWRTELDPDFDPVQANVGSLSHLAVREGMLDVLRASEIINAQRFTYREVWGCAARALAGALPSEVSAAQAEREVIDRAPDLETSKTPDFDSLRDLARHRWFVALFGGLDPSSAECRADPVLRLTTAADPLFDASPDWARRVLDAFAGTAIDSSPLAELRGALPQELQGAVQPFDEMLDTAFLAYCRNSNPRDRASAQAWYGRYLTRLYATAMGIPAFKAAVEQWVAAYRHVGGVPDGLKSPLRTLLSPRRFPQSLDSQPLVPLFASRPDPIIGYVDEPVLALRADAFQFSTGRQGEDLKLVVKEDGATVGEVRLDFELVREAMTCAEDWQGMTEASDHISPRVERFRARRVASEAVAGNSQLAVAFGDRDMAITIDSE